MAFLVLLMLMGLSLTSSPCLEAFVRVALSRLFSMFWLWKCWRVTSEPTPTSRAFVFPITLLPVISAYADDTSLVLGSDQDIVACLEVYKLYEHGSGSKLNLSKCEGLWLGAWNGRSDSPVPITWSSVKIEVLGVFLGPGNLEESNWRPRIEAVEHVLNSWHQRSLSFKRKALVVNTLALARIWYVASLIHVPEWVVAEINKLIFKFFWSGKRDLVARKVVVQPFCNGVLGWSM